MYNLPICITVFNERRQILFSISGWINMCVATFRGNRLARQRRASKNIYRYIMYNVRGEVCQGKRKKKKVLNLMDSKHPLSGLNWVWRNDFLHYIDDRDFSR